jgi:hypothetical protein
MPIDRWVNGWTETSWKGTSAQHFGKRPNCYWMRAQKERLEDAIPIARGIGWLWRNVGGIGTEGAAAMIKSYQEGFMSLDRLL